MSSPRGHWLDHLYGRLARGDGFFSGGWGDLSAWRSEGLLHKLLGDPPPIEIHWTREDSSKGAVIREGWFDSPLAGELPTQSKRAAIQCLWPTPDHRGAVCLHMAATGDEGFARRRRTLAGPLLAHGVGAVILENPYYGVRRPPGQKGVSLHQVRDLFAMGFGSLLEGLCVLRWLDEQGFGPLGVSGVSMGGQMAVTIGSVAPMPLAISPCIASHSATPVFTEGMLSRGCDWEALSAEVGGAQIARSRLRDMLDETDIRLAPSPRAPHAVVQVAARRDAYLPQRCARIIREHCPGSALRWLDTGHVSGFVLHRKAFKAAILESFERLGP